MAKKLWPDLFVGEKQLNWEERSLIQIALGEAYTDRLRVVFFHRLPELFSEQQEWKRIGRTEWLHTRVPKAYLDRMMELAKLLDQINPQYRMDSERHLGWRADGTPYFLEPYYGNGRIFVDEYGKDIPEAEYETWPYHKP